MTADNPNPCILCKGRGIFRKAECLRCKGKGTDPWKPRVAERAVNGELRRQARERNRVNNSIFSEIYSTKKITKGRIQVSDVKSVDLNPAEDRKYKLSICQKCSGTGGPRSNCSNCGGSGWVG